MKTSHMIALFVVLWAWDRHNQSQSAPPVNTAINTELGNFTTMQGTNFTNSVWDPVSGQPAYQFGTVNAPGGTATYPTTGLVPDYSGAFGHM